MLCQEENIFLRNKFALCIHVIVGGKVHGNYRHSTDKRLLRLLTLHIPF